MIRSSSLYTGSSAGLQASAFEPRASKTAARGLYSMLAMLSATLMAPIHAAIGSRSPSPNRDSFSLFCTTAHAADCAGRHLVSKKSVQLSVHWLVSGSTSEVVVRK